LKRKKQHDILYAKFKFVSRIPVFTGTSLVNRISEYREKLKAQNYNLKFKIKKEKFLVLNYGFSLLVLTF